MKNWKVLLEVGYEVEAESEERAKEKARDRADRDVRTTDIDPSGILEVTKVEEIGEESKIVEKQ